MKIKLRVLLLVIGCSSTRALADSLIEDNRLVHEGVVVAAVKNVWAALTTKEGQESWMVAHSEVELKIGGRMRTHYPERMLSIQVTKTPEGFPFPNAVKNMWTIIYFEAISPRATRVRFVGLGFGDDEESKKMRAFFDRGNAFTLKKLQE